jgi:hypothetical protein
MAIKTYYGGARGGGKMFSHLPFVVFRRPVWLCKRLYRITHWKWLTRYPKYGGYFHFTDELDMEGDSEHD